MLTKIRQERVRQLKDFMIEQRKRDKLGLDMEPYPAPSTQFSVLYDTNELSVFDFLTRMCETESGREFAGRLMDV